MTVIQKIQFAGGEIHVIAHGPDGKPWVSVRKVCEELGITVQGQLTKLKNYASEGQKWAGVKVIFTPSNGGEQETCFIAADSLPTWMNTIPLSRVNDSSRKKLLKYKNESAEVLANHFVRKDSLAPSNISNGETKNNLVAMMQQMQQTNLIIANMIAVVAAHEDKINEHEQRIEEISTRPAIREIIKVKTKKARIEELKKTFHATLAAQNRKYQVMPMEDLQRELCSLYGKREYWDQTKYQIACNYLKKHYQFNMSDVEDLFIVGGDK